MIKVRYVAQVEVDAVMLNERVKVPVTEIAERIRGTWITKAIAEQVRGVFDRRADIKVTTQLADVVEIPDEMPDEGRLT